MTQQEPMTVAGLKSLLQELSNEIPDNFEIWLSSDEEGNEFLPMLRNHEFCLAVDSEHKRIVFYPAHL